MQNEFIFPVHVFTEDTDYSGVVYHANFLNFMERARSTWAIELGMGLDKLAEENIFFVVKNVTIDYLLPARLHDNLEVVTRFEKIGRTSIVFAQDIRFAKEPNKILTKGQVVIVCINEKLKPRPLPEILGEFSI